MASIRRSLRPCCERWRPGSRAPPANRTTTPLMITPLVTTRLMRNSCHSIAMPLVDLCFRYLLFRYLLFRYLLDEAKPPGVSPPGRAFGRSSAGCCSHGRVLHPASDLRVGDRHHLGAGGFHLLFPAAGLAVPRHHSAAGRGQRG